MKFLKIVFTLMLSVGLLFGGFVGYIILTDYQPSEQEPTIHLNVVENAIEQDIFTITTFNIGYCGLDAGQDFFLDGGTMSRTSSEQQTLENLDAVIDFIDNQNSDFYLLQEVDEKGTRSANVNQLDAISSFFSEYSSTFSYNFKAPWIPIPVTNPMGSAYAGLMNLSKFQFSESIRHALPVDESFPYKYFDLDRSIMEDIYQLNDGKTLHIVNIHLSAYDEGGLIRAQQARFLIDYINKTYNENTYIIFGGDWNHLLDSDLYTPDMPEWVSLLPDELFDTGFYLAYDNTVNTVRSDDTPYTKGVNFETVIDGFLVSPNIEVVLVEGHDLEFANSDHQPVTLTFKFK